MLSSRELLARDREHLWHPYAPADAGVNYVVQAATGVRLQLADATGATHDVIDAMSSWWCMVHGYQNPVLTAAARAQLDEFSHVMFGGLTHPPAVAAAEQLLALCPDSMTRVFWADSGSVSVEVALKAAVQVALGRGRTQARRFVALRGGYHGDTLGAMSVCDPVGSMHATFTGLVPEHLFIPRPPLAAHDGVVVDVQQPVPGFASWAQQVRDLVTTHADQIAGFIVEPLLQGAGGMYPYPAACLQLLRELADQLGAVLIFDEIATGCGRLGQPFASQVAGVVPDILCVGKALTGGYLTLAAMVCSADVAADVDRSPVGALLHGPTFMGNPLACAVAKASLELVAAPETATRVAGLTDLLAQHLAPLAQLPHVARVSVFGSVAAIALRQPVDLARATSNAVASGVWLRPFRELIYTMPAFMMSAAEVSQLCVGLQAAVQGESL